MQSSREAPFLNILWAIMKDQRKMQLKEMANSHKIFKSTVTERLTAPNQMTMKVSKQSPDHVTL